MKFLTIMMPLAIFLAPHSAVATINVAPADLRACRYIALYTPDDNQIFETALNDAFATPIHPEHPEQMVTLESFQQVGLGARAVLGVGPLVADDNVIPLARAVNTMLTIPGFQWTCLN